MNNERKYNQSHTPKASLLGRFGGAILFLLFFSFTAEARRNQPINFLEYAKTLADAEIARTPATSMLHASWNYRSAFLNDAFIRLYDETEIEAYFIYVKTVADKLVDERGQINSFDLEQFDLRNMLGGNFLYDLFLITRDRRYLFAMNQLRRQLHRQPRAENRLFWFTNENENLVRIDGFYMALPFYSTYAAVHNQSPVFEDIVLQIRRTDQNTLDAATGLNFQAWNGSTNQSSQALFAQSIAFYLMGLVDILDYFPVNHPARDEIIGKINRIVRGLDRLQDSRTGMWFQVVNMQRDSRNFLDAGATAMFAYAIAKSVNNGYLPQRDRRIAERAFQGLINNSLENGNLLRTSTMPNLNNVTDGTAEFYFNLPQTTNEPSAVAAFILAGIQLAR